MFSSRSKLGSRYWWLWTATSVSSLGDGLVLVAFPLLALSFTHDPLALSGLLAAQRLPWLVCSLPLGALADRSDRRRMAIIIELGRMALLLVFAGILLAGASNLGVLYAAAFGIGALETGFFAATAAVIPDLVHADRLAEANGHLYVARTAGEEFVGPAIGGLLFVAAASLPFVLDGVSFLASAGLLLLVFGQFRHSRLPTHLPAATTRLREDVAAGVRYLAGQPVIRLLAAFIAGLAFCQAMVMGILVKYGTASLRLSKPGYGVFLAVGALGSVAAGVAAGRAHERFGTTPLLLGSGVMAACGYLALGASRSVVVAALALFVESVAVGWGNVTSLTVRQQTVPAALLGRTQNAFRMLVFGAIPLGALFGGLVAARSSLAVAFLTAGALQLSLVAAAAPALARRIREVVDVRSELDRAGVPVG